MALLRAALICFVLTPFARAETISVSVAISLKDATEEIAAAYKAETRDDVRLTFGSSGQLMAQIRNGAPADAFISAANKQVDELIAAGRLDKATRRVVAGNKLVLIVPANAKRGPASFVDLADARHLRIAVGEPKTVPAGQYAMQLLTRLDLVKSLEGRLVYGANVRQVLDYVSRGEVAAGIVYATDAKAAGDDKVCVVATADADTHDPIEYPAAVVSASTRRDAAKRFLDYLGGEKARAVLAARGFTPVEKGEKEESAKQNALPRAGDADKGAPRSADTPKRGPAAR